ncbi:hypothetical protein IWZ00DRAFT_241825 [Phyllosticta capitalensis]
MPTYLGTAISFPALTHLARVFLQYLATLPLFQCRTHKEQDNKKCMSSPSASSRSSSSIDPPSRPPPPATPRLGASQRSVLRTVAPPQIWGRSLVYPEANCSSQRTSLAYHPAAIHRDGLDD